VFLERFQPVDAERSGRHHFLQSQSRKQGRFFERFKLRDGLEFQKRRMESRLSLGYARGAAGELIFSRTTSAKETKKIISFPSRRVRCGLRARCALASRERLRGSRMAERSDV